jgi:hypothetical protein
MSDSTPVTSFSLLDKWTDLDWSEGLQVESVEDMSEIRVETRNTVYEVTIIDGHERELLVRGGKFFPERTPARLAGSSLCGTFLKIGGIYAGFNLEIIVNDETVITSQVQSVHLYPARS